MKEIYLDNAATTRLLPEVLEAMRPYLEEEYGNPSAIYRSAARSRAAVDRAREQVAALIGAKASEIYFTSGGTEADNWALIAASELMLKKRGSASLLVSAVEHHAVLHTARYLEERGVKVHVLPVDAEGRVNPQDAERLIAEDTALISVMTANNEIGTIEPVKEIAEIAHARGVLMHTDAVQACGHLPLADFAGTVDLLSASAHKLHGPKGIGFLYIRSGVPLRSFLHGGAQERGRRAGTENTAAIVGFGAAAALAARDMQKRTEQTEQLRNYMIGKMQLLIPGCRLNGPLERRLPGNMNFLLPGVDAEALLIALDMRGIAASAGSACAAGSLDPSHVLLAAGLTHEEAMCSIRLSISHETTKEELDTAAEVIAETAQRLCRTKG
ncbi:MAG: cysteine desulfurase family protein [Lachnospiraceae bacterium]|nr:cysteine desulfurase family protein [Lachnospiraceae bacterium]